MTAQAPSRRTGRPPKSADAIPTRDRLIAAAIEVFVERGFGQANITEIAERAGISGPAVYKHFDGKADLLMEAARHSLDTTLRGSAVGGQDPSETARRWLSPGFEPTRRLLLELHLTAGRETDLTSLLAEWHLERTALWQTNAHETVDRIKAFYLLLLGLAHVDSLSALDADPALVQDHVDRMVDALFAETAPTRPAPGS
ncbi:MAG: helix-turn-helix domain-containing protein [Actinomycetota bacterium]